MENKPQNPEFRINPENFHQCIITIQQNYNIHLQSLLITTINLKKHTLNIPFYPILYPLLKTV